MKTQGRLVGFVGLLLSTSKSKMSDVGAGLRPAPTENNPARFLWLYLVPVLVVSSSAALLFGTVLAAAGGLSRIEFFVPGGATTCADVRADVYFDGFAYTTNDFANRDYGRLVLEDGAGNTLASVDVFKDLGSPPSNPAVDFTPLFMTGITQRPVRATLYDTDGPGGAILGTLDVVGADPGGATPLCAGLPGGGGGGGSGNSAAESGVLVCNDDRVNCEPQATAILYCRSNGVHVYGVDRDSQGTLAFVAAFAVIDALGVPPANTLLASGSGPAGPVALYRLSSGEFQLVSADFEPGKTYNFIWEGCPRPPTP